METKQKRRSERFKREALARWRLLAASGMSLEQGALEIGVTAVELRAWSRGVEDGASLLVPVQVAGDVAERRTLVVVFADGVRVEGLRSRRSPSWCRGCRDRRAGPCAGVRVWRPVDLRKGFEGLSALVQQALDKDPQSPLPRSAPPADGARAPPDLDPRVRGADLHPEDTSTSRHAGRHSSVRWSTSAARACARGGAAHVGDVLDGLVRISHHGWVGARQAPVRGLGGRVLDAVDVSREARSLRPTAGARSSC
ncbi:hypothetical protein NAEX_00232 [Nannocystis exedens]|nr:hypothetical protein NAEX_00232 [Nannocystis exedens]